jgi:hypothetical protein
VLLQKENKKEKIEIRKNTKDEIRNKLGEKNIK